MIAVFGAAVLLLISAGVGSSLLRLLRVQPATSLERVVYATPLGLGITAYCILALGLLGLLSRTPVAIALACLAALALPGFLPLFRREGPSCGAPGSDDSSPQTTPTADDSQLASPDPALTTHDSLLTTPESGTEHLNTRTPEHPADSGPQPSTFNLQPSTIPAALLLTAIALIAFVACFVPPAAHEWDALSYHLAAPKVYIEHHRILLLPTDHHSNFPFTMEMLFTVGLLFQGYAMADLVHFATGVLTVAAIIAVGRRRLGDRAAILAAVAFSLTPIVIWEAGAAYIELGMALFVLTSVGAALEYLHLWTTPHPLTPSPLHPLTPSPSRWLVLSACLMGFALSVKALALVPFVLLAGALLLRSVPPRAIGVYVAVAVLVGSPFYVKSWVMTGNPVYPFAYRLFPHSKYWNAELAATYQTEQVGFGQSGQRTGVSEDASQKRAEYAPPSLRDRIMTLIEVPFDLVAVPRIFYNYNDPGVHAQLGFLFLSLPMLALVVPRLPREAVLSGLMALAWFLVWSQSMQYVRYLIPLLPLALLCGGSAAARLSAASRVVGLALVVAVLAQAAVCFAAFGTSLPEQIARATNPEEREQYLQRQVNVYQTEQWVNSHAAPSEGVVLFEETRGFYLDRPYLWGNSPHSTYIPYGSFANGAQLADWFVRHGYRYGIVNLQFSQPGATAEGAEQLRSAVGNGTVATLLLQWYNPNTAGERWRRLLGEALSSGAAVVMPDGSFRGAVLVEFRPGAAPQ